jgi:hypothetical protein
MSHFYFFRFEFTLRTLACTFFPTMGGRVADECRENGFRSDTGASATV